MNVNHHQLNSDYVQKLISKRGCLMRPIKRSGDQPCQRVTQRRAGCILPVCVTSGGEQRWPGTERGLSPSRNVGHGGSNRVSVSADAFTLLEQSCSQSISSALPASRMFGTTLVNWICNS